MSSDSFASLRNLKKWPISAIDTTVRQWWQSLPQADLHHPAIALSGGADSTALLLAVLRLHCSIAMRAPGKALRPITILHVHHGLQASADTFAKHCAKLCAALQTPAHELGWLLQYIPLHVQVVLTKGQSLEARAREERYHALAQAAQHANAQMVLLGQHADDQAESMLLALSRGAGMAGLAGMPALFQRHGMLFARPLLHVTQHTIKSYLQNHQVPWVEDPSNTDQRFTRNRLRHTVLPALEAQLPGFGSSLARSARLAAQADTLLQELAQIDLQHTGNPPQIALLRQLATHRQANALRHWLKTEYGVIGSESQILALLQVIAACTTRGHRIRIKVGDGYVVRSGPTLQWQAQAP